MYDTTLWEGEERIAFALFSNQHIFACEYIPRPKDIARTYGKLKYRKFDIHHRRSYNPLAHPPPKTKAHL